MRVRIKLWAGLSSGLGFKLEVRDRVVSDEIRVRVKL